MFIRDFRVNQRPRKYKARPLRLSLRHNSSSGVLVTNLPGGMFG
jgi:hypothetical protein